MKRIRSNLTLLAIIAFFIFGIWIRLTNLGKIPVGLYWDEVAILVEAKAISQTGRDLHGQPIIQAIFPSYGDYKLPGYIWAAALAVKAFGVSAFSVRLPSAIIGILTPLIAGCLGLFLLNWKNVKFSKLNSQTLMLAIVVTVVLSPWSILFSRTAFEGNLGQFFLACSILVLFWKGKSFWIKILSAVLGLFAVYTYFSVRFVWPVLWLMFVGAEFFWLIKKSSLKSFTSWAAWISLHLLLPLLIFTLGWLIMIKSPLYAASNQFRLSSASILTLDWAIESNELRQKAGNSLFYRLVFHRHVLLGRELLLNYADNLSPAFMFMTGDPNLRHGTGVHGLFLLPFSLCLLIGLIYGFRRFPFAFSYLIVWWLIALLPASVPETTPHALRSLNALVPISVIIGFGLWILYAKLINYAHHPTKFLRIISTSSLGIFSFCLLASFGQFYFYYLNWYPSTSSFAWQGGYAAVAQKIDLDRTKVDQVYVLPFDSLFFLWYEAFSKAPATDFQFLPKTNYQFNQVHNITFNEIEIPKRLLINDNQLFVGKKRDLESLLPLINELKPQGVKIEEITGVNADSTFLFIYAFR